MTTGPLRSHPTAQACAADPALSRPENHGRRLVVSSTRLVGEPRRRALDRHRQWNGRVVDASDASRRLDETPGVRLFENLGCELGMQRMPGAVRDEMADDRMADEREVADGVENLVADELVLEPQRVVEPTRFAQHDGVLERAAERQTVLAQHLDVLEERERARRRDLLHERGLGDTDGPRLMAEQRMVVADAVGDLEVIRRVERNPFVAARDGDRTDDLQVPARLL